MLSWSEPDSMPSVLSNLWLRKRRPHWERLGALLAQADQTGLGQLSRAELQEMALLYRQVAADISVLRQDPTARTYAEHVNQLLARAHHIMYSRRKTSLVTLFRFLRDDYPAIFQKQFSFVFAALVVTVSWGALGAVVTSNNPAFMRHYIPPAMISTMERHQMWTDSVVSVAPMESSFIMTNNLTVSFLTFAGGILFGLGTFWLLYFNGMMLGVIAAACHQYGMSMLLWSFVAPHGSLELPSILIAGGAGFRLGYAMLFPGNLRWKDSVAQGGLEATRLVTGIIPLLVIAGTLEGFFSPSHAAPWLKFTVGGVLFTLLNLWLFRPVKPRPAA
ncbi:MAG TPA: stage II sporulation protein M [Terracidiphilus sp.]|nr:stage II sporulation protein M [Terracidiphilus sp.]